MRHAKIQKRISSPDTLYDNPVVTKLINYVMRDGKKTIAQDQVYKAFELIKGKNEDPIKVFERALQTVGPKVEVKSRRVGGANYQVPIEVKAERRNTLALRWILEATRKRSQKEYHSFAEKLSAELMDAANNQGEEIRKRDNTLKQAESNRAFSHFRF